MVACRALQKPEVPPFHWPVGKSFPAIAVLLAVALGCASRVGEGTPGPAISVRESAWEFGSIKRGQVITRDLKVANAGSDTLKISIFSTCDCLQAQTDIPAIAPGQETSIRLSYMGDEVKERVTKTVFIDSNDPAHPRLSFRVTGRVDPGVLPHLGLTPDPLPLDRTDPSYPLASIAIRNKGQQDLHISEVRCFGCINEWSQITLAPGEGIQLQVEALPDWTGNRWIEIDSDDPVTPLKKVALVEM